MRFVAARAGEPPDLFRGPIGQVRSRERSARHVMCGTPFGPQRSSDPTDASAQQQVVAHARRIEGILPVDPAVRCAAGDALGTSGSRCHAAEDAAIADVQGEVGLAAPRCVPPSPVNHSTFDAIELYPVP